MYFEQSLHGLYPKYSSFLKDITTDTLNIHVLIHKKEAEKLAELGILNISMNKMTKKVEKAAELMEGGVWSTSTSVQECQPISEC